MSDEVRRHLESWKEIAQYLGRDIRTVMRWEQERGLPVHRLPGKRQIVSAFTDEIDTWLRGQEMPPEDALEASPTMESPSEESDAHVRSASPYRNLAWAAALLALLVAGFMAWRLLTQESAPKTETAKELVFESGNIRLKFHRENVSFPASALSTSAIADLNGDGKFDIVSSLTVSGSIAVLLGTGNTEFGPLLAYENCPDPREIAVADFNHDGKPDIAVVCQGSDQVLFLWGSGNGRFDSRTSVTVPGGPRAISVADFNADGWPDLVVSTENKPGFTILINQRTGFSAKRILELERLSYARPFDVNHDGFPDLLFSTAKQGKFGAQILLGNGKGEFTPGAYLPIPEMQGQGVYAVIEVHAGDLNNDGIMDLVAFSYSGGFYVFLGEGGGKYRPATEVPLPRASWIGKIADLNGDGIPDVINASNEKGTVTISFGKGDGTFLPPATLHLGHYALIPTAVDFNHDGRMDLLVPLVHDHVMAILLQEPPNQE